jgi:hypothetical protein
MRFMGLFLGMWIIEYRSIFLGRSKKTVKQALDLERPGRTEKSLPAGSARDTPK